MKDEGEEDVFISYFTPSRSLSLTMPVFIAFITIITAGLTALAPVTDEAPAEDEDPETPCCPGTELPALGSHSKPELHRMKGQKREASNSPLRI